MRGEALHLESFIWLALASDGWSWSGRWESNPRLKLGKLGYYHYTTPAYRRFYAPYRATGKSANASFPRCDTRYVAAADASAFPGPRLTSAGTGSSLLRQGRGATTTLFMGDRFVKQYYPRIDWLVQHEHPSVRSVVFATSGGCPPIPNVHEAHHGDCSAVVASAIAYAGRPEVDSVVIGANWLNYFQIPDGRYTYYYDDGHPGGR
jgi:hypothetical protein